MAADPKPDWLCCLPSSWTYGVTRDGRIFFINEEAKSTTWLHPVTGEAVITGHRKTPDLPTGWEEGYTFEGARCFINHNERKVTCKHPVSGVPSQDNCIFVVNEQLAPKASAEQESSTDKKERPMSIMSEASNYTGGSDYSNFPGSPSTTVTTLTTTSSMRPSRSSKKVHNFGKRSNSIKRNLNAPVVKRNWLYKQDSTGMKLWKKRWFVLSDMCLFYYRDEKEESILGSILLPSFHISMLSVDDHISKRYAFKATHPNMRTYYFCTDTAKEMESWMKVMTDAALVHTEPVRRLDKLNVDQQTPQQWNNLLNHTVLTQPEIQNNERNREPVRQHSLSRADDKRLKDIEKQNSQKDREYYTLQRDGEKYSLKKDGVSYMLQKDGDRYLLHKDGERYLLRKDGEKYSLQKDVENYAVQKVNNKYTVTPTEENCAPSRDGEKFLLTKDGEKYALQKVVDRHTLQKDGQTYVPQKEVKRQLSLKETERYSTMRDTRNKYGTIQIVDKYGNLKEVRKYSTLREGNKYAAVPDAEKYATIRAGEKYCFQRDPSSERSLNKISSIKLQPAQAAAIAAAVSASRQNQANLSIQKPLQVNSSASRPGEQPGDCGQIKVDNMVARVPLQSPAPDHEPDGGLSDTNSMQQLELRARVHRTKELDDDTRSVMSYQTLPRNMPSHRAQIVPCYPEGYRTLPRNSMMRPDSICSVSGSVYDRALRPVSTTISTAEKRRSMRDDTMWQLYEWQQRQAFSRQSLAQPTAVGHYGTLPSTKTMGNISEHAVARSISTSPSHGSLALYNTFSLPHQQVVPNPNSSLSEVSSPVLRGDGTLDRRQKSHLNKYGCPSDRRSIATCVPPQTITPQSLQGKTPEELTLLLIKLRRQQAEINSLREHTVAQLMALGIEGPNAKQAPDYRLYKSEPELTTVKEEGDEANGEEKDKTEMSAENKDTPASKVPPYPVGIVAPRTKSPMIPPESSTIASYVTLRKTKKPESKCDRPRSAVDQMGFGEREFFRSRMSIEEQLERMKRNQEASSLREKRRETLSRSSSFSKDNPLLHLQVTLHTNTHSRAQTEGACLNPVELETALLQIKVAQKEQSGATTEASGANSAEGAPISPQKVQRTEQVKDSQSEDVQQEKVMNLLIRNQPPAETNNEMCESKRVVNVDLGTDPKHVETVNFQPSEYDESKGQDLTSSPTNTITENSFQTPNPKPKEQESDGSQTPSQGEHLEKTLDSYKQLTGDSKTHINNNMLATQTFTLVRSDT
ncbi:pleckstrin homology domain-containing family A member 5 isoform 11-T11 [Anableps anableps]